MDHHCSFIGSCVGKYNIKFFVQFCVHMTALLIIGLGFFVRMVLIQNIPNRIGVQGFSWIFLPPPFCLPEVYRCVSGEGECSITKHIWIDNCIVDIIVLFMVFAAFMGYQAINNVLQNSS